MKQQITARGMRHMAAWGGMNDMLRRAEVASYYRYIVRNVRRAAQSGRYYWHDNDLALGDLVQIAAWRLFARRHPDFRVFWACYALPHGTLHVCSTPLRAGVLHVTPYVSW